MFRMFVLAMALVCAAGSGFAQGPQGGSAPPPEVTFVTVESKAVPIVAEYIGVLESSRVAQVRSRIKGFIASRTFEEGAFVKEGEVLYRIDRESFEADVEIAKAQVEVGESQVRLAESEVRRQEAVKDTGAMSQGDMDRAKAQLDQARGNVRRAKADLSKAELELSYTDVKSPTDGIVSKTIRDQGALVDTGENSLLTEVWRIDPIYLNFGVSSRDYLAWKNDTAAKRIVLMEGRQTGVQLMLEDGSIYPLEGKQNFEDPSIDPTTGTIKVRAEFPNPDKLLKPGQFVKVLINGWERPDTIVIPQRAVNQSPAGASVMLLDKDNKVVPRPVTLGTTQAKNWIIRGGLEPGDRVMVDGYMKFPGAIVKPVPYVEVPEAKDGAPVAPPPAPVTESASSKGK